jgi:beta-lactamase class A
MFGLGKKKKKDDDEEVLEKDLPAKRKFKDLKPGNRKARKEPIKPWGKQERYLVLGVLTLTVITSIIFNFMSKNGLELKLPTLRELGSLSLPSFEQKFVFESDNQRIKGAQSFSTPISNFRDLTNNLVGSYGFFVVRLDNSFSYGLNENDSYTAASLIKLPTVMALYKEAEAGNINLEDRHAIQWWEKVGGNGSLVSLPVGTTLSYRDIAEYMIIQSDNTAFNIVENLLGERKIQEFINGAGMTRTSISDNLTSPADTANLLVKLVNKKILTDKDSSEILSYLKQTDFSSWLVAGIPKEIEVAHKYGDEVGTVNDAGIVYTKRPYVVIIMSREVNVDEANSVFPSLSKLVYDFESKN